MFLTTVAQKKNYGILTIKKEDIKTFYDNNVKYIVFKYKKPFLASYKLVGTPFDSLLKPVLSSFKPKKVKRHNKQKLENVYKGILVLSVDSMQVHGIDSTFDIYLFPLHNSEAEGANYVSYLINNTPDSVEKSSATIITIQAHTGSSPSGSPASLVFTSFTLNPSPPYKSGL